MEDRLKVAVVGDFMQDVYWVGKADRLSPEAPIPVITISDIKRFPGGAGNVSANLTALGCQTFCFGDGLPIKHRLLVDNTQLARWDQFDNCYPSSQLDLLKECGVDAIVVSDYGKGSIDNDTIASIKQYTNIPIFVDTKRDPSCWSCVAAAVFPNDKELKQFSTAYEDFSGLVVYKRGSKGLCLFGKGVESPSQARFVRSVNGAGDTVMAAFVYAYLSSSDPETHMGSCPDRFRHILGFANAAAACAVEAPYTYAPTLEEVRSRYAGF